MQGNLHSGREVGDHALAIQRDDLDLRVRKILGQEAATGRESVVGVGDREIDLLDADLERIPGLRALNKDRSSEDVAARAFVGHLLIYVAEALLHLVGGHTRAFEALGTAGYK